VHPARSAWHTLLTGSLQHLPIGTQAP